MFLRLAKAGTPCALPLMRIAARSAGLLLVSALLVGGGAGCTKQMRQARYLAKGDKDFAAERYDVAEIEYLNALRYPTPAPHALARLGIIYYTQGRWVGAMEWLNEAVKLQATNAEARIKL